MVIECLTLHEFIEFAEKEYIVKVSIEKDLEPDTFEKLFGVDFISEKEIGDANNITAGHLLEEQN